MGGSGTGVETLRTKEFLAVDDVSFQLRRGECLALLGANGAGKSTLLKLLNGLIKPDAGKITMRGRIGALIELGSGFNPILTGRENIYVNSAILGISRREVDKRFDEIVEFSEIGEFLDSPVQSYSSGMKVRLGFAVAAQMNPDVLIIDEVLAVGDAGFRAKCYNRLSHMVETSAVILVTHAMPHVARLASQTIVLKKGRVHFSGNTPEGINAYYGLFDQQLTQDRIGSGEAIIESIELLNADGNPTDEIEFGSPLHARLTVDSSLDIDSVVIDLGFLNIGSELVAESNNFVKPQRLSISAGRSVVDVHIDSFTLNPGVYRVATLLLSENMSYHYDWVSDAMRFSVVGARPASAGQQFSPRYIVKKC